MRRTQGMSRRAFGRLAGGMAALGSLGGAKVLSQTLPQVQLGPGASLGGARLFPANNPWNQDVSRFPVDPHSATLLTSIGLGKPLHPDFGTYWDGAPNGMQYEVVSGIEPMVPTQFVSYPEESDPGPYPIPLDAPIEGCLPNSSGRLDPTIVGGDRHVIVLDRDHWKLYELFYAVATPYGWQAASGAVFDLNSNALRPAYWTSADAAGLPILPGLVRYDEVFEQGAINHALRFTVARSRAAFVYPARHFASWRTDPSFPPMGMRVRLKASYNVSGFPKSVQVILNALKKYGMILADNGGDWFVSGAHDPRWSDNDLHSLTHVMGQDLEVVRMGVIST